LDQAGEDAHQFSSLAALVGLFGDPVAFMAAAKAGRRFSEATHDALNKVRKLAEDRVDYCEPGQSLTLEGVPGARIYILGPPQNERLLRAINPSTRKPSTYSRSSSLRNGQQLTERIALTLALRCAAEAGTAAPLTDAEKELLQNSFPFEPSFRVTMEEAAKNDFFRRQYGFASDDQAGAGHQKQQQEDRPIPIERAPAWRRIHTDWLDGSGVALAKSTKQRKKPTRKSRKQSTTVQRSEESVPETPAPDPTPAPLPVPPSEDWLPFDAHLRVELSEAEKMPFFWNHYGFDGEPPIAMPPPPKPASTHFTTSTGPEWRRIDTDWLGAASELALQMDNYTNNTSLALAIELVDSGKVLLFPADAQIGNWLSWDDISPPMTGTDQKPVTAADLLRRTVFYKVGHHGSHNATMRELGLERMTSPELVAFVPVDERVARDVRNWRDMPFGPLLARLYEMTTGRVIRLDSGVTAEQSPNFLHEDVWHRIANSALVFRDQRVVSGGIHPQPINGDSSLYFQLAIAEQA
jgi:hypothetical protein